MNLYTTTVIPHEGTLLTAPRPLPGTPVAYVGGSGFRVFDVLPEYLALADDLDAQPVTVITDEDVTAMVVAYAAEQGYPVEDFQAAYGSDATIFNDLIGRLVTLEPIPA